MESELGEDYDGLKQIFVLAPGFLAIFWGEVFWKVGC